MNINAEWIVKAVKVVKSGLAQKLEKDGVTVYSCGKIIRIDIKASAVAEEHLDDCSDTSGSALPPECADDLLDLPWD